MREKQRFAAYAAWAISLCVFAVSGCGSEDDKKTVPKSPYEAGAGAGGEPSGVAGEPASVGGNGQSGNGQGGNGQGGEAPSVPGGAGGDVTSSAGAGGEAGGTTDDSLRAFYPFSGNSLDESGHGNDCTPGTATLTADRHGNADSAYSFNGEATSYLSCGNDASLDITGALTLAAWFKPEAASLTGLNRALIAKWFPPNQRSYALLLQVEDQTASDLCDATQGLSLIIDPVGTGAVPSGTVCDDTAVTVDEWQHAAAVFEPGVRLAVYSNGVLVAEKTGSEVVSGASSSSTALLLGRNNLGYYAGSLDDARVYARALSAEEVAALAAL